MHKIGIVGDKDSILGFKALGLSVFPVANSIEGAEVVDRLAGEEYAVIFIIEDIAKDMIQTMDKYKDRRFPALIMLPGNGGPIGIGMMNVKKSVERAVGADILFRE